MSKKIKRKNIILNLEDVDEKQNSTLMIWAEITKNALTNALEWEDSDRCDLFNNDVSVEEYLNFLLCDEKVNRLPFELSAYAIWEAATRKSYAAAKSLDEPAKQLCPVCYIPPNWIKPDEDTYCLFIVCLGDIEYDGVDIPDSFEILDASCIRMENAWKLDLDIEYVDDAQNIEGDVSVSAYKHNRHIRIYKK